MPHKIQANGVQRSSLKRESHSSCVLSDEATQKEAECERDKG